MRPLVSIVMRSYNDIEVIGQTLRALKKQTFQNFELWNHDSSSLDGTLSELMVNNDPSRILVNDPSQYVPGKVLNKAVECCRGGIIVFLNSDATPTNEHWLEKLIQPLLDELDSDEPTVGAVFGRQVARKNCWPLFVKDTERAFGDGSTSAKWVHFFSMANSAVRKDVALRYPFATDVQYSEDIEWSKRLKQDGLEIRYVQEAVAIHSHNYSLKESYKRHYGEGKAEAAIFSGGEINFAFWRYVLAPVAMEVLRDVWFGLRTLRPDAWLHTVPLRLAQKMGRWKGLRDGLMQRELVHD